MPGLVYSSIESEILGCYGFGGTVRGALGVSFFLFLSFFFSCVVLEVLVRTLCRVYRFSDSLLCCATGITTVYYPSLEPFSLLSVGSMHDMHGILSLVVN